MLICHNKKMNIFSSVFNTILYQPLLNILVLFYQYIPGKDFGVAVILLTVLIKLLLYPLGSQALRAQKNLATLQPKIKEIEEKYKNEKEKQVQATLELYKKEKINPFSGCLPVLIQLPILIALYQLFWRGFKTEEITSNLYGFLLHPGVINTSFLGLFDLAQPNVYLAVIAGILQFIQSKTMPASPKTATGAKNQFGDMMQKQMLYFLPFFTVLILWNLPSALGLYWVTTIVFSIIQQYLIFRKKEKTV